ncbi:hypothetical protein [Mixta gaviniae]|uniref:hypothetical protein n=1 Tax=Mixta gaviniae TaxID=665914 RepID=UPI00142E7B70|nr:hypothetical protein [Mixta gaviniae]
MNTHTAVPVQLTNIIQSLTNGKEEQVSTACKEDILEMYLIIGALLQWKYQLKFDVNA